MYQDRAERVPASYPISYVAAGWGERPVTGNCINISTSGLLGEFEEALELWTEGEVTLHFGEGALGLKARVARVVGRQAGMVFRFTTEEDRQIVADMVTSANATMQRKTPELSNPSAASF